MINAKFSTIGFDIMRVYCSCIYIHTYKAETRSLMVSLCDNL